MSEGKQYPFHELRMIILAAKAKAQEIQATLNRGPGARELALCITKLEEAAHWSMDAGVTSLPTEILEEDNEK